MSLGAVRLDLHCLTCVKDRVAQAIFAELKIAKAIIRSLVL